MNLTDGFRQIDTDVSISNPHAVYLDIDIDRPKSSGLIKAWRSSVMVTVLQQHYPSLRSLIALQCGIYNIKYIHIVTLSCQSYHISPATNLCWQLHQTFRTSNILWFIFDLPKQYYLNIYLRILVSSKQSTTIISLKGSQKSCFTFELLVFHRTVFEVLENGGQLGCATLSAVLGLHGHRAIQSSFAGFSYSNASVSGWHGLAPALTHICSCSQHRGNS